MRYLFILLIVTLFIIISSFFERLEFAQRERYEIVPNRTISVNLGNLDTAPCQRSSPQITWPKTALKPAELALIVNEEDPQSVAVAREYQKSRQIPHENVIHIHLNPHNNTLNPTLFKDIKNQVDSAANSNIQAYALSFSKPFRVGCMSITSAFALGYDQDFCQRPTNQKGCRSPKFIPTAWNDTVAPYTTWGIRPTMMLAGRNTQEVLQLIRRGAAADKTFPKGTIYLVNTRDRDRSVRSGYFIDLIKQWPPDNGWKIQLIDTSKKSRQKDFITDKKDVLFYFTGMAEVPEITSNQYQAGAIADHLTSFGGDLFGRQQMSILRWLEAGVTASYGTVVEPCNFTEKFPNPRVVVSQLYRGKTLLEAYWSSVISPQEGLFIGDPLAKPMGIKQRLKRDYLSVKLSVLKPGQEYQILSAQTADGPYLPISEKFSISNHEVLQLNLGCNQNYYQLTELDS